ncbi:hypothetical protein TNCV_4871971 [Trichonephila clavipes]|nr:hypothetical protein TNCV_4871971 [Trichonephila clavipes]
MANRLWPAFGSPGCSLFQGQPGKKWASMRSLLDEVETDQARLELPDEIMDINLDSAKKEPPRDQNERKLLESEDRESKANEFEVDSDDVQEPLDSHNLELTIDDIIEIHEQDIETRL